MQPIDAGSGEIAGRPKAKPGVESGSATPPQQIGIATPQHQHHLDERRFNDQPPIAGSSDGAIDILLVCESYLFSGFDDDYQKSTTMEIGW